MPAARAALAPPVHRHLSPAATARLLGAWHAGGPAYTALADALRAAVLAGTLAPHTRLPSERDLAVALGVSRTTTAGAFRVLREQGFVRSRTGAGTVTALPRGAARAARPVVRPSGDAPSPAREAWSADVLDLSQATPPAPPELHAAYARALEALPAYLGTGGYAPLGVEVLREAVAARYTARGLPTSPDQVLVTTGAQHGIATVARTLLHPGDRAAVQSPTYAHAMAALRSAGGRLVPLPVGPGTGTGADGEGGPGPSRVPGLDVDLLASTLRRAAPRLVYLVPDFHNPTGYSLTAAEREQVREAAARHRVTVLADETLSELVLDGAPHPPLADAAAAHVVTVGSASKTFWGGLRVGWLRAHPDVVAQLARTREHADIGTSVLEQLAVAELLREQEQVLRARLPLLRSRRDRLRALLAAHLPAWRPTLPDGGLSLWVDLGAPLAGPLAAAAAADGVLVNAGPTLTPDGTADRWVRLTYTPADDVLDRAVPRLAAAWARVAG